MKVYQKSCETILDDIFPETIDLVISSPPYKFSDGYSSNLIDNVSKGLYTVLKNNSLCFINFGHLAGEKDRPFEVVSLFKKNNFTFVDTIIWVKSSIYTGGHYTPINSDYMLNNMFEYIFMFSKGKAKLDRLSIGTEYLDKSNIERYGKQDLRCAGNIWYVSYPTVQNKKQKPHKDMFPDEIPKKCILLSGIPKGSKVLDPFLGSGTVGKVAEQMGMDAFGYEINPIYFPQHIF